MAKRKAPPKGGGSPQQRRRQGARTAQAIDHAKRAVELRVEGRSIRDIAAELRCAPSTALDAIRRGLELTIEATKVPADTLRAQETERLEFALRQVVRILGDEDEEPALVLKAAAEVRQISQRLSALHGLDAPTRVEQTIEEKTPPRTAMEAMLAGLAAKIAAREQPPAAEGAPTTDPQE